MKPLSTVIAATALALIVACNSLQPSSSPPVLQTPLQEPPHPAVVGPWSAPVAGLKARVESPKGYPSFIRFQNVGDKSVRLLFLIQGVEEIPNPWRIDIQRDGKTTTGELTTDYYGGFMRPDDPSPVPFDVPVLGPGESALVGLTMRGETNYQIAGAQSFKITVAGRWGNENHQLEITGSTMFPTPATEPLPLPTVFPIFSTSYGHNDSGSGDEPELWGMNRTNAALVDQLAFYPARDRLAAYETQLEYLRDSRLQICYAMEAACLGSARAKEILLNWRLTTDYRTTCNLAQALDTIARRPNPPEWVFDTMIACYADQRTFTDIPHRLEDAFHGLKVRQVINLGPPDFTYVLGQAKCRKAVPLFVAQLQSDSYNYSTPGALADIGDPQAIPALLATLQKQQATLEVERYSAGLTFRNTAHALLKLRAPGVYEILAQKICHADIALCLEALGDHRVVPLLRAIIQQGYGDAAPGVTLDTNRDLVSAARLALITLDSTDPVPAYVSYIADHTQLVHARARALEQLARSRDPRAIPALLKIIREESGTYLLIDAVKALSNFSDKPAIAGLIDCLDLDFTGRISQRIENNNSVHLHIADALTQITGKTFGPNAAEWRRWLQSQK